jgi:hypothetical protein
LRSEHGPTPPFDPEALRLARAKRTALVAQHPELTSPERQARLEAALDELEVTGRPDRGAVARRRCS